jgi:hypothetical protein
MNPPLFATPEYLLEPPQGEFRIGGWATSCTVIARESKVLDDPTDAKGRTA